MKKSLAPTYYKSHLGFCPLEAHEFVRRTGYNFVEEIFNKKDPLLTLMNDQLGGRHFSYRSPINGLYAALLTSNITGVPPRNIVLGAISLQEGLVTELFTNIRDRTGVKFISVTDWNKDIMSNYIKGMEKMLQKTLQSQ